MVKEVPLILIQKLNILRTSLEVKMCISDEGFITRNENLPPENKWFNDLLDELDSELSAFLITSKGTPDYQAHRAMELQGYPIKPGETDSFGWLTGICVTSVGKIVYG